MITGVIKNQVRGETLVVTLPCSLYDLRDHLKKDVATDRFHFYQQYVPCQPSAATGVKYLIEETDRYRLTMENYARACKAAEDEEYEMPEDEDWERRREVTAYLHFSL